MLRSCPTTGRTGLTPFATIQSLPSDALGFQNVEMSMSKIKPIDFGPLPDGLNRRETAEEEARRDLQKPEYQLLTDVHDELLDPNRSVEENIAHANKRIASLMVRMSMSSERLNKTVVYLTWVIVALTVVLVGLTMVMLF